MAVREGWRGRFFEDFEVGDVHELRAPLGAHGDVEPLALDPSHGGRFGFGGS
jgi:hypothetical protein